jgi:hypothetical protein
MPKIPSSLALHKEEWNHIVLLGAGNVLPADGTFGLGTLMASDTPAILADNKSLTQAGVTEEVACTTLANNVWAAKQGRRIAEHTTRGSGQVGGSVHADDALDVGQGGRLFARC